MSRDGGCGSWMDACRCESQMRWRWRAACCWAWSLGGRTSLRKQVTSNEPLYVAADAACTESIDTLTVARMYASRNQQPRWPVLHADIGLKYCADISIFTHKIHGVAPPRTRSIASAVDIPLYQAAGASY